MYHGVDLNTVFSAKKKSASKKYVMRTVELLSNDIPTKTDLPKGNTNQVVNSKSKTYKSINLALSSRS